MICEDVRKVATEDGQCVCMNGTHKIKGECIDAVIFTIVGSVLGLFILAIISCGIIQYKNRRADELWKISLDELLFDDPVEVIGEGSFGVVILAEYRGTKVAIKQAVRGRQGGSTKARGSSFGRRSLVGGRGSIDGRGSLDVDDLKNKEAPLSNGSQMSAITGESEGMSSTLDSSDGNDDGATPDVETGTSIALSRKYEGLSLGKLVGGKGGKTSKWYHMFPSWITNDSYEHRFKETILGTVSGSTNSRKTTYDWLCPWFSEQVKRYEIQTSIIYFLC